MVQTPKIENSEKRKAKSEKEGCRSLAIHMTPKMTQILAFRRRTVYTEAMSLHDKLDYLCQKGICQPTVYCQAPTVNTFSICKQFSDENHETMLADTKRIDYYRMALKASRNQEEPQKGFAENCQILEIGTGPYAILAINALNAGARFVDAVEVNFSAYTKARNLMDQFGFTHFDMHCIHSKQFPLENKKYDLILHEILGDFASQEGVADIIWDIQKRLGYRPHSIPYAASTAICPAVFPEPGDIRYPASSYPERTIVSPQRILFQSVRLNFQHLQLASFQAFETLRFEDDMADQMIQKRDLFFLIDRPGKMAGLLCGIDVEISPGQHFGTCFNGQTNSWYTSIILLPDEVCVKEGNIVHVKCKSDLTNYEVATPVSKSRIKYHSFKRMNTSNADYPKLLGYRSTEGLKVTKPCYTFEIRIIYPDKGKVGSKPKAYQVKETKQLKDRKRNRRLEKTWKYSESVGGWVFDFDPIHVSFEEQAPRLY